MGYRWKKSTNLRKILVEKSNIVAWRDKYLRAIDSYRRQGKNVIYLDETWVDNTLSFSKCWQSNEEIGVLKNNSSSHRYIIVHAGGEGEFVKGAALIFKARSTTGDYHGQMNALNFEKWVSEKLLPNIPSQSVIVMDNAPYHTVQINKPPTAYGKKSDMIKWLEENNIQHTATMKKYQLVELIQRNKSLDKTYRVDELFKRHGHNVLRLPPYMCELNPIELAWAKVKRIIRENNTSTLTATELIKLTETAINDVTTEDWVGFCKHIKKIEDQYVETDNAMENIMEEIADAHPINATSCSNESSDSDTNSSSSSVQD
ncbi:uncharacterized protein LOC123989194 [Osmia bicornis bicornis]|uniref:uncharacterized protein LOC123989194 n=1 Tax=Osmia bicornis bicornis TaxID=1437191 RepID=UPI001EAF3C0E|nr:uncharacterized protein LOC123989194 [Osmia bicornis bicornis]